MDHKPLIHLFSENRSVPAMASARLQRWALVLSAYQYKIVYKCGKDNVNADMRSCLPLPECPADVPTPGETVLLMETFQSSPVSIEEIRTWTKEDPVLSKVKGLLINGWKGDDGSEDLCPFRQRQVELSLQRSVGLRSGNSKTWTEVNLGRTPLRASRDFKHEEPGSQLCLVAKTRCRH